MLQVSSEKSERDIPICRPLSLSYITSAKYHNSPCFSFPRPPQFHELPSAVLVTVSAATPLLASLTSPLLRSCDPDFGQGLALAHEQSVGVRTRRMFERVTSSLIWSRYEGNDSVRGVHVHLTVSACASGKKWSVGRLGAPGRWKEM